MFFKCVFQYGDNFGVGIDIYFIQQLNWFYWEIEFN